ncbi:MAG: DUF695 domain-containing protein [Myxococcota bacterium]
MAYAPMFEMWSREEDDVSFDMVLDLGHGEDFPLSGHPWFFGVRIPMAETDDEGRPTEPELKRLDLVENRVREIVRDRDGLYVGRRTGGGARDLVFYMPDRPSATQDRVRASVGTDLLFIGREDPAWEAYEAMLPKAREWRQIEDRKGIQALLNADADPAKEHRIEHRIETSSRKGAEALVKLLEKMNFEEVGSHGKRPEIIVSGYQIAPLELEKIHKAAWILESKAPKAKGTYLGWNANPEFADEVVEEEEPELDAAEQEALDAKARVAAMLEALSTGEDPDSGSESGSD